MLCSSIKIRTLGANVLTKALRFVIVVGLTKAHDNFKDIYLRVTWTCAPRSIVNKKILTNVFRVLVNNSFKEIFYENK